MRSGKKPKANTDGRHTASFYKKTPKHSYEQLLMQEQDLATDDEPTPLVHQIEVRARSAVCHELYQPQYDDITANLTYPNTQSLMHIRRGLRESYFPYSHPNLKSPKKGRKRALNNLDDNTYDCIKRRTLSSPQLREAAEPNIGWTAQYTQTSTHERRPSPAADSRRQLNELSIRHLRDT